MGLNPVLALECAAYLLVSPATGALLHCVVDSHPERGGGGGAGV